METEAMSVTRPWDSERQGPACLFLSRGKRLRPASAGAWPRAACKGTLMYVNKLDSAVRLTQWSLNECRTVGFAVAVRMGAWATGQTSPPLVLINYSEKHYFSVKVKTCLLWDLLYKYSWCRQLFLPAIHLSCLRRGISLRSVCGKQVWYWHWRWRSLFCVLCALLSPGCWGSWPLWDPLLTLVGRRLTIQGQKRHFQAICTVVFLMCVCVCVCGRAHVCVCVCAHTCGI